VLQYRCEGCRTGVVGGRRCSCSSMSCAFSKRLFVLVSEVIDLHFGSLSLFSKPRWGGEEERTVVDGKAGLNVLDGDGCVSEVETVIDGL
jgi:hypothetical protein